MKPILYDKHYASMEEDVSEVVYELVPVEKAVDPLEIKTSEVWKLLYPEFKIWHYVNDMDIPHLETKVKQLQKKGKELTDTNEHSKHVKHWSPIIKKIVQRITRCKKLLQVTKKRCNANPDRYKALHSRLSYYLSLKGEKL